MDASQQDVISRFFPLKSRAGIVIDCHGLNDNLLPTVTPLSETDVRVLIRDHALVLATMWDVAAGYEAYRSDPMSTALIALQSSPDLQRGIIWLGSTATLPEIDRMDDGGALYSACAEIVLATYNARPLDVLASIIAEELRPFCRALQKEPI